MKNNTGYKKYKGKYKRGIQNKTIFIFNLRSDQGKGKKPFKDDEFSISRR